MCAGQDYDEVAPRKKVKSMLSAKSFRPVHNERGLLPMLSLICAELAERLELEFEENSRRATTLVCDVLRVL